VRAWKRGLVTAPPRRATRAIAVDLGATQHRVSIEGRGLILQTPARTGSPWQAARQPACVRVAGDFADILRSALPRSLRHRRSGFPLALAVPAALDDDQKTHVRDAALSVNNEQPVLLMEGVLAAASAAEFDVTGELSRLIIDIGAGRTEIAAAVRGQVMRSLNLGVGTRDIERAVIAHLYERHRVLATPAAARGVLKYGSAREQHTRGSLSVPVNSEDLQTAIRASAAPIVGAVRELLREAGAATRTDVLVTGGGATIPPLVATVALDVPGAVVTPRDPRRAVIRGLAGLLDEARRFPRLWLAA